MGQRLNIEIVQDEETKANSYYHWSAYTSSAIELTKEIVKHVNNLDYDNHTINAIKLLEVTSAGLSEDELTKAQAEFPGQDFQPASDRNAGLIAYTPKGMEDTQNWEEGRVTIDLDNQTVDFEVYSTIEEEEYEDWNIDPKDVTEVLEIDLHEVKFDELDQLKEFFDNNSYFKVPGENDRVYTVIE